MSVGWIWTTWTVLMLALAFILLKLELGAYEMPLLIIGGVVFSVVAIGYERTRFPNAHQL